MNLKEANKQLEQLENEYEYWLKEKENLLTLVNPKSPALTGERVSGGTRSDKYLKYIELDDEKKINETLDYIHKRKQNVLGWLEKELKRLNKYDEVVQLIVFYKEVGEYNAKTEKFIKLTNEQIGKKIHYSPSFVKKEYRKAINMRSVD